MGRAIRKGKTGVSRVVAWNVRSLRQVGKLENLKLEMDRLEIDAAGISEMRWPESGDFWSGNYRIIHTGSGSGNKTGVGIILNKKAGRSVRDYIQYSDRIVMVRLESKPVNTVIIQVYMPTSAHSDDEIEEVYSDLEEVLKFVKGNENLIILGDWNAVIGEEEERGITGKYGLGTRNERDNRLIEFCNSNKLTIANTLFKNHKRRRYTWKMPGDIGRYQIDYIMVRQRFKNQVKDCRSYPGPDIDSDHTLVMMKYKLKF